MQHATDLLSPADPGYDCARNGFQIHGAHEPVAVMRARTVDDVVAAVREARSRGLRVATQATGHGLGVTADDLLLVDTSALDGVTVDPVTRRARIGAGATWGAVTTATAPHGLAAPSGSAPGVGVAGYLVHGGLPLLGRAHGWAAEDVRALDVVTADGELRHLNVAALDAADADLAWALRGGGGSFAIVTAVEIELRPVDRLWGGQRILADDEPTDTLRCWRDWAAGLPDEVSTSAAVIPFPPAGHVPAPLRGRTGIAIRVASLLGDEESAAVAAPIAEFGAATLLDDLGPMRWSRHAEIHRDPPGPFASASAGRALGLLPDDAIRAATRSVVGSELRSILEIRRLGGALSRAGSRGPSLPVRRDAEWHVGTVRVLRAPGAPVDPGVTTAAREADAELQRALDGPAVGRIANLLFDEARDPAAVRSAWSWGDLERLRAVKRAVDPDQLLLGSAPIA